MDHTDIRILNILQGNARMSMTELGNRVGLTSPAVTERVKRLEEKGIIEGYRTIIKRGKIQKGLAAFINMEISSDRWKSLIEYCENSPYVLELYHTIGVYGAMLKVFIPDTETFEKFQQELGKYGNTTSSVILSSRFSLKELWEDKTET